MNKAKRLNAWEGTLAGGLHYMAEGSGPPLVMFNTVTPSYKNPRGIARWGARRFIRPLTQHFTVYAIGRRPGLSNGTTMADIATDYAHALTDEFKGDAVTILGVSTGGSIALQFAADYPELVQKLVLAGTAYRLGPVGRDVQRRYADLLASGHFRQAFMSLAPVISDTRPGQWFWKGILWLFASLTPIEDPSGMVAMLMAEDAFDLGDRLHEITAPVLLIGGARDNNYSPELMKQTAERIPHARLIMYPGLRHNETMSDRRFFKDVLAFLTGEHSH